MTTALEIITGAARLLGVVRKGEALDGDEAETGLDVLNQMIESWQNSGLLTNGPVREVIELTSLSTYIFAAGFEGELSDPPAFVVPNSPPLQIVSAFVRSGGIDYPLEIITSSEYENISIKNLSGVPRYLTYTRGEGLVDYIGAPAELNRTYYGTMILYPTPSSGDELHLLSEKSDYSFPTLSTSRETPPGWIRAYRYNLALELAPEYSVEPSRLVIKGAMDSLGAIKLTNARNRKLRTERDVYVSYINSGYN